MTLLNAPEFNEQKEKRTRNVLVGSGVLIIVLGIVALTGFVLGHGWFFVNLPVEHRVDTFLAALQAKDYPRAYGIFYNSSIRRNIRTTHSNVLLKTSLPRATGRGPSTHITSIFPAAIRAAQSSPPPSTAARI